MLSKKLATRTSILLLLASGVVAGIVVASGGGAAVGATANIRPICVNRYFSLPATVGGKVTIPTHEYAADPDVTPIKLVSVFNAGSQIGTVAISGNDLVFTLTSATPGTVYLYWTVSDGSLTAQCLVDGSNEPPPDNG